MQVISRTDSLSSATSTVSFPPSGGPPAATGATARGADPSSPSGTRGRYILKTLPRPGSEYTLTAPPCCFTIP